MPNSNYSPKAQLKIAELQAEIELMRKLTTTTGFYEYYFSQLKFHKTNVECFNTVNDKYYDIFGEYRYSSYNSFAITKIWGKNK